jgi:hypothetical protein
MAESQSKNNIVPSIEDKDIYKIALDTRNLEISLFWQRSNYFLVLNSALALGFFNLKEPKYSIFMAIFGIVVLWLWFCVNLGSKFWQSRWEQRLSIIENKIDSELKFFSVGWDTIYDDVTQSLAGNSLLRQIKRWLVLKKPSVSNQMMWLSVCFMLGWAVLIFLWWRGTQPHG